VLNDPSDLFLPIEAPEGSRVRVSFIAGDLRTYDGGEHPVIREKGETIVRVPITSARGLLSSGVYVVYLRAGDDAFMQKLTVIR
jgi:hypothetical protein